MQVKSIIHGFVILFLLASTSEAAGTGMAVWHTDGSNRPQYSRWNGSSFAAPANSADIGEWRIIQGAEAPTRDEIIVLGVDQSSKINGEIWDGSSWTGFSFNDLATVSESFWWGFDVAYEQLSGDALIVWNNGSAGTKGISYRVWNGIGWAAEDSITTPLSGEPQHMHLAARPGSDELLLIVSNDGSQDYALVWNGSEWGSSLVLDNGSGDDRTDVYVAYERQSGDGLVTYGKGGGRVYFRTWDGSAWSAEDSTLAPAGGLGNARWAMLASDPGSDRIAIGILTTNQSIWASVWDGAAWSSGFKATGTANGNIFPAMAVAFEALSGDALLAYGDGTNLRYRTKTPGSQWSNEKTAFDIGDTINTVMLDSDPNSEGIMLTAQDATSAFFYAHWDGSIFGSPANLESNTTEVKNQPFIFLWHVEAVPNHPPVLAAIGARATDENVNLAFGVSANDLESTPVLTTSALPPGAAFVDNGNGSGDFNWTPAVGQAGSYGITFYAIDDSSAVDSEVVTITVFEIAVNQPPVLAAIGAQVTTEHVNLSFVVSATDIESTPTLATSALPSGASFDDNGDGTGDFDWTPGYPTAGNYSVTFYATDDSSAVDSESVTITVDVAPVDTLTISPDSLTIAVDSTVTYRTNGHTSGGNPAHPGGITWSLTSPIGTIDSSAPFEASFHATAVGTARVVAVSDLGPVDTTAYLAVTAGPLATLTISPDSATVSADSSVTFTASGEDAFGNDALLGTLTWEVIGDIGNIEPSGLFTPQTAGNGRIAVTSSVNGTADTNEVVIVTPGLPISLTIAPDTAVLGVADSTQFSVVGHDAKGNSVELTDLSWTALGRVGTIDTTGLFVPRGPGFARVSVASSMFSLADTNDAIFVEALDVSGIPIGTDYVHPSQSRALMLACRIENYFLIEQSVSGLTAHLAVRGPGSTVQRLGNLESVELYLDSDDDSLLTEVDSLIATAPADADSVVFSFASVALAPDSGRTFLLGATVSASPRDGDSLDLYLFPQLDIERSDDAVITGPDSLNSLGYSMIDGMLAGQLSIHAGNVSTIGPSDSLYIVMALDVPRNGYSSDVLEAVALENHGTAGTADFDSLVLLRDNGNLTWDGAAQDGIVGRLVFTGGSWVRSGLSVPLNAPTNRFYIGAAPSRYPNNGATLALGIPRDGLTVASGNDGPIDQIVPPIDTVVIVAEEQLSVQTAIMPGGLITPDGLPHAVTGFVLTNSASASRRIDSMIVTSFAVDPRGAPQADLDRQFDSIYLYHDLDGLPAMLGSQDTIIATGKFSGGAMRLTFSDLTIPATGGSRSFTLAVKLDPRYARDGNSVNLGMAAPEQFFPADGYTVSGDFPIVGRDLTIDRFAARDVPVVPQSVTSHFGGQIDQALFQFQLPANGYADDRLERLTLTRSGTLESDDPIIAMNLWLDVTGNGFTTDDELVGSFVWSGQRWKLENLSWPISGAGHSFIVTVDLAATQFEGGTYLLTIPRGGVQYESGLIGPDDASVSMNESHLIVSSNRVTAVSIPIVSSDVAPGSNNHPLMTFALYNGYVGRNQTLRSVHFTNVSSGLGGNQQIDDELGQVAFYIDADGDRALGNDSLVAVGRFAGGQLRLDGLSLVLPPESLSYFFVASDLPLRMTDGDRLAIEISETSDLVFSELVSINGNVPISSGNYLTVDGSVRSQYAVHIVPSRTLTPGDTSVLLMAFQPAANGYHSDILTSVRLVNNLTADSGDLSALELWRDDNGDQQWQSSDSYLGSLSSDGAGWLIAGLTLPIDTAPPTLLVTADVATSAAPDARVQLTLPAMGCLYSSENDGPRDGPLSSPGVFTVSTSGLRLTMTPPDETYSVGQDITIAVTAHNVSGTTLDSVGAEVVNISDSSLVLFQSAAMGPVSLPAGDSVPFTFVYQAVGPGFTTWDVRAVAVGTADTSALLTTPVVTIQRMPSPVAVALFNSMPTAVTRGQANVFPLSLAVTNTDTSLAAAPIQIDSLTFTVVDGSGLPQSANSVFSRVVLSTQYANLVVLESIPGGSAVTLRLPDPVRIGPGTQRIFSLLVDIDSLASANVYALSLRDTGAVAAADINTGIRVPVTPVSGFPMTTASCRIENPSRQVAVSREFAGSGDVNEGQSDVTLLRLGVRHPGSPGVSQIQVSQLSLVFVDVLGDTIPASAVVNRVQVRSQQLLVGELVGASLDSSHADVVLNSPLTLSPSDAVSVEINATIREQASEAQFRVVIADSSMFTARDLSSGSLVDVVTDTLVLATGSVFPIESGDFQLRLAALPPLVCFEALAPASLVGGIDAAVLIGSSVSYDADADHSALRLVDSAGAGLHPGLLFDRIGYRVDGGQPSYQQFVELESGRTVFHLGDDGLVLMPGDQVALELLVDLEVQPAYDNFAVIIDDIEALVISDVTETARQLSASWSDTCLASLPLTAGPTSVIRPAGRPIVTHQPRPVRLAFAGDSAVPCFFAEMTYSGEIVQGDVRFDGLSARIVRRGGEGLAPLGHPSPFSAVNLFIDDVLVSTDSALTGDVVTLQLPDGFVIASGFIGEVSLAVNVSPDAVEGNYAILMEDSTSFQMQDRELTGSVYPILRESSFPLASEDISIVAPSLERSFTNYPNPFRPDAGELTTIGYVLPEDAWVDIELFTITGELVATIIDHAFRTEGAHQDDRWDGRNGVNLDVVAGTYFCRITARYGSGREETFRRKIAVVR